MFLYFFLGKTKKKGKENLLLSSSHGMPNTMPSDTIASRIIGLRSSDSSETITQGEWGGGRREKKKLVPIS